MSETTDVLVIGGGVIGSAIAYFLKREGGPAKSVTVIERDSTYARASTPLSAGGIRQQFSIRENVEIGLFARDFLRGAPETLAVNGDKPDLTFRENGYLFLAGSGGRDILAENHAVQTEQGADILWCEPDELATRFPWIRTDDLAAGTFGLSGEGWIDPNALLQAFRRKARAQGATYVEAEVADLTRTGRSITEVTLSDGTTWSAGTVVISAGANSGAVARMVGLDIPVGPRKRSVFIFDCRQPPEGAMPLTIDPSGVFVRPEGAGYISGYSPPEEEDPETWNQDVDWWQFEEHVWPTIAHRIPAFEAIKPTGAWAGWYDYNSLDHNAIIGFHSDLDRVLLATGFSGHGLQQGPAMGRAAMELIEHGAYQSLDLSRFSPDRLAQNRPIRERNVV